MAIRGAAPRRREDAHGLVGAEIGRERFCRRKSELCHRHLAFFMPKRRVTGYCCAKNDAWASHWPVPRPFLSNEVHQFDSHQNVADMPFINIEQPVARALAEQGYAEPTPVQSAVLQADVLGKDLLVSAQTGSGKTIAFGLAIAPSIIENDGQADNRSEPLALIVAPTRELALQVHRELSWLFKFTGARLTACVGGMDIRREQRLLSQGTHIVVGTPGRLRDHLERGNIDPSRIRSVVLDEADEMLDLGFREDLEFILDATPTERRTLLFSATIPKEISALAKRFQRNAQRVVTAGESKAHGDIEYRAFRVAPTETEHAIVNVLRYFEAGGAMIFCSTREAVRRLHGNLIERGFIAVALSGEMSQNERTHALQSLRDGRARVCVATDVAARGIDLPDLGLVIHADLPNNRESLLHRSGRTGRAGRKGVCVLIVPHTRRRRVEQLLGAAQVEALWSSPPSAEEIRTRDQQRLVAEIAAPDEISAEDKTLIDSLLAERSPEQIAAALIRLHRERLPAPEELLDAPRAAAPSAARSRESSDDTSWFRVNVGRNGNADPRWLVPLICRRGHVTKQEIGAIRILDRESKFEIASQAAERFLTAATRPDEKEPGVRFEAVSGGPGLPPDHPTSRGPRPGKSYVKAVDRPTYKGDRKGPPGRPNKERSDKPRG